jgi:hypothetical protein
MESFSLRREMSWKASRKAAGPTAIWITPEQLMGNCSKNERHQKDTRSLLDSMQNISLLNISTKSDG